MHMNTSDEMIILRQAIEGLYATFERYQLPEWTDPCMHCHEEEEELRLHAKPLRKLTHEDLEPYVWSALLTWGDVDTFKHFIPRIFELTVENEWFMEPEIILSKLRHGEWRTWFDAEQTSVRTYLMAVWRVILSDESFDISVEEWLCALGQAEDDLNPYLDEWYRNTHASSRYQLADFIIYNFNVLGTRRKLMNSFWSDRREQMGQVINWLLQPSVSEILEQAFFEHSSEPESENLSWAVDQLTILRERYAGISGA
ncbi:MAG: hypothetical protein ACYC27_06630 [Armatimonadota bacterium]